MFLHSREPQRLDDLPLSHPLRGLDLRTLSDERLADAAARAILPGWAPLWQRIDHRNPEHSEVRDLASSVLRRTTRVIVQGTRVAQLSEGGDSTVERLDELLESTTLAFVQTVGAFDALAIINGLLGGLTKYPDMAWQYPRFRDSIRHVAPAAAALMDKGTSGDSYFAAIRAFRNTIHRRLPDIGTSVHAKGDPGHAKAIFTLESRGHQEIIEAFTAAGWTKFVGIELGGSADFMFLQPRTVLGLLAQDGVPLLDALLRATPVHSLGPVQFTLDADATLYPSQMQRYAVDYLQLAHLLPRAGSGSVQ